MNFIKNFTKSLVVNYKKMPIAAIFSYLATILSIFLIANNDLLKDDYSLKIVIYFITAFFLSTSLSFFKNRVLTLIASFILALIFWYYGTTLERDYFLIFAFFLILAATSISFWAPFVNKEATNVELFGQIKGVVSSLLFSLILALLLIAGTFIALGAFNELLGVYINDRVFGYFAVLILGIFGANYYMNLLQNIDLKYSFNRVEELFAKYILPIFTIGYFIILYAYSAKIIINTSWPKGYLAWFILFFTLVAYLSYLFLTPYKSRYKKFILIAIIPQAIMLLVAVYKRVDQYGFTESRYMLVVYGLFLIFASLYLLIKNRYKYILIAATITLTLCQVGPISAWSISKNNQYKRFLSALKEYKDGNRSLETKYKLSSAIDYLSNRYSIEPFRKILPKIAAKYDIKKSEYRRYNVKYFICNELGFSFINRYDFNRAKEPVKKSIKSLQQYINAIDVKGYDWLVDISGYIKNSVIKRSIDKIDTEFLLSKDTLVVKSKDIYSVIDLKSYIKRLNSSKDSEKLLIYNYKNSDLKIKLVIKRIRFTKEYIVDINGFIFYKNLSNN